jgi:hypothetical protein
MRHGLKGLVALTLFVITLFIAPVVIASLFTNLGAVRVLQANQRTFNDVVHCTCEDFEYSAGTGLWRLALRVHENARANFWLGQAELQQGHYAAAIQRFLAAQRVSGDTLSYLGLLAGHDSADDYQGVLTRIRSLLYLSIRLLPFISLLFTLTNSALRHALDHFTNGSCAM